MLQTPKNKVREKSRECHNHKPQPFPDTKRKRKPTNPNKHKPNKRTKSTKISSLFPRQGNRNTKRTEKHKNKMTHGTTYNKSPRQHSRGTKRRRNEEQTMTKQTPQIKLLSTNKDRRLVMISREKYRPRGKVILNCDAAPNNKRMLVPHRGFQPHQGPLVQSVVGLTSSLVVKMLTVLVSTISNS